MAKDIIIELLPTLWDCGCYDCALKGCECETVRALLENVATMDLAECKNHTAWRVVKRRTDEALNRFVLFFVDAEFDEKTDNCAICMLEGCECEKMLNSFAENLGMTEKDVCCAGGYYVLIQEK